MPTTQSSTATLRPDIAAALREYDIEGAAGMFIGLELLPVFESDTDTGEYAIFGRENVLNTPDVGRADDGGFNRVSAELKSKTYACEEHGLEYPLTNRKAKKYKRYIDFEIAMARVLWLQIRLAHERRVQAIVDTLTSTNATTAWATIASADIIGDIDDGADALADASGINKADLVLAVSRVDFRYMRDNAAILDRIKYTNPKVSNANATAGMIADVLGIGKILPAGSGYNIKQKGVTPSVSQIWGTGKAYLVKPARSSEEPLETPCLGRTVLWTDNAPEFPVIETYEDTKVDGKVVRVREDTDEILQASDGDLFGYAIDTTP